MNLVSLELDYNDYLVILSFDKLDSINIDENLQVCTCETIRGKNKTFNAYLKPIGFTISGKFSDMKSTNIRVVQRKETVNSNGDTVIQEITAINSFIGKDKSARLNALFDSLIEDTRLINIRMFYKNYENYNLTNFNLNYANNNTINVELTLQEALLRDLNTYSGISVPYKIAESIDETKSKFVQIVEAVSDAISNAITYLKNLLSK